MFYPVFINSAFNHVFIPLLHIRLLCVNTNFLLTYLISESGRELLLTFLGMPKLLDFFVAAAKSVLTHWMENKRSSSVLKIDYV